MTIQYKKTSKIKNSSKTAKKPRRQKSIKAPKISKAPKKYTKNQIEDRLHASRIGMLGCLLLASFAGIISASLIITGSWDDISVALLAMAPLFASVAVGITFYTWRKMHRRWREFVISFVAFLLFSSAFFFVSAFLSIKSLKQYYEISHEPSITGAYKCASSEEKREFGVYDVRFILGVKEYAFEDYRSDAAVVGNYEASYTDDGYQLKTLIKSNTQKDKVLNFEETDYTLKLEEDNKMRLTLNTSGGLRFCTRE